MERSLCCEKISTRPVKARGKRTPASTMFSLQFRGPALPAPDKEWNFMLAELLNWHMHSFNRGLHDRNVPLDENLKGIV